MSSAENPRYSIAGVSRTTNISGTADSLLLSSMDEQINQRSVSPVARQNLDKLSQMMVIKIGINNKDIPKEYDTAIIRELREETSLEADLAMDLFRHESGTNAHIVFLIKARGNPKAGKEVKHIAYYNKDSKLNIDSSSKEIIDRYLKLKEENKEKSNL